MPTASQPSPPSPLSRATAGDPSVPRVAVGASKRGSATIVYSHVIITPSLSGIPSERWPSGLRDAITERVIDPDGQALAGTTARTARLLVFRCMPADALEQTSLAPGLHAARVTVAGFGHRTRVAQPAVSKHRIRRAERSTCRGSTP